MAVIKLGDLTTFTGDTSGSWLVMNDPTNTATYKVQREQLLTGLGPGAGVSAFNTRTGFVTLLASDISGLGAGIVSSSTFSSPSQGTLSATINGASQNVDLGLQTGDSVQFAQVTANLIGTASYVTASSVYGPFGSNSVISSSYALTASFALNGGGGPSSATDYIASGNVTASVSQGSGGIFLIKSGSVNMFEVSGSGRFVANSSLFIIKNYTTQQPVFTVSESVVKFATQSAVPTGNADNGAFWFTATNFYVGLD